MCTPRHQTAFAALSAVFLGGRGRHMHFWLLSVWRGTAVGTPLRDAPRRTATSLPNEAATRQLGRLGIGDSLFGSRGVVRNGEAESLPLPILPQPARRALAEGNFLRTGSTSQGISLSRVTNGDHRHVARSSKSGNHSGMYSSAPSTTVTPTWSPYSPETADNPPTTSNCLLSSLMSTRVGESHMVFRLPRRPALSAAPHTTTTSAFFGICLAWRTIANDTSSRPHSVSRISRGYISPPKTIWSGTSQNRGRLCPTRMQ